MENLFPWDESMLEGTETAVVPASPNDAIFSVSSSPGISSWPLSSAAFQAPLL